MTFDEPVDVNSSLKVTKPTYFLAGMHVGQQVVGGVSFLQGTVINTTNGNNGEDNPVTIGDNLRVDGRITRGFGPVIVDDDLWVTKNIKMNPGMTVDGVDISALRITDWNAAFGWGNHALQGYLTTEVDPIFTPSAASGIVDTDITNWNTAFGWGNHAAVGYLQASNNLSDVGNATVARANIGAQTQDAYLDDIAALTATQGDILFFDGSNWDGLNAGTDGEYLKTNGAASDPEWGTPSSWHGSTNRIKLLPTDFISDSVAFHLYMDDQGRYINLPDNANAVANISIPIGYQATEIYIDAANTRSVNIYANSINNASSTNLGTGNTNSLINITDLNSNNSNYLSIWVDAVTLSGDQINGGYVTIQPIP